MIPIYICEDQPDFLEKLTELIQRTITIENFHFQIELATQNPEMLIEKLEKQKNFLGIYFLDIDLGKDTMNGFELGKKIRSLDSRGFIIYITTHEELLSETFIHRLETLDFILKDEPDRIKRNIVTSLKTIETRIGIDSNKNREYFAVKNGGRTSYVPLDEIIYFETTAKKHVVAVNTLQGRKEFYDTLEKITERLNDDFIRVHRSFLVNSQHISGYNHKLRELVLSQNHTCDIARGKLKEINHILTGLSF